VALAAVAALGPSVSLSFSGGEQPVIAAIVVAASRTTAVRARVRTVPPSRRHPATGRPGVDRRCIGWRVGDVQASIGQRDSDNRKVIRMSPYARPPSMSTTLDGASGAGRASAGLVVTGDA
jgi:hypothetical protein